MIYIDLLYLYVAGFFAFILWTIEPWKNLYCVENSLVDEVTYKNEKNVFKKPLKKVLRAKRWSQNHWDVFVITECNWLTKKRKYILTDPSESDLKLMEQFKRE